MKLPDVLNHWDNAPKTLRRNEAKSICVRFREELSTMWKKRLCSIYLWDATEELNEQIVDTCDKGFLRSSAKEQTITHSMNAELGFKAFPAV